MRSRFRKMLPVSSLINKYPGKFTRYHCEKQRLEKSEYHHLRYLVRAITAEAAKKEAGRKAPNCPDLLRRAA